MTQPPPRTRRKAQRPGEVLDAALSSFAAKGFAATRMEDIARGAGVSKGTLYLYYPSKEAIFEALVRTSLIPNIARAETQLAVPGTSASARLRILLQIVAGITANPRLAAIPKLVLAEAGNFPDMARFYRREVVARGLALLESLFRAGIEAGEFRAMDPHLTARLFMAPVILGVLWQTTFAPVEDAPVPPATLLAMHADVFLRGIAADPEQGRAS